MVGGHFQNHLGDGTIQPNVFPDCATYITLIIACRVGFPVWYWNMFAANNQLVSSFKQGGILCVG